MKENIFTSKFLNFTNQNSDEKNHQVNIAVNYQEGFDLNKRSDIFWYPKYSIKIESVIVYYENQQTMLGKDAEQTAQEFFRKCGVSWKNRKYKKLNPR